MGHGTGDGRLKLTAYFGERQRSGRRFLADEMLDLATRHRIATSVALRGIEGVGPRGDLRTDRLLTLSEDSPMVVVAVDDETDVRRLAGRLREIADRALFTLERVAPLGAGAEPVPPGGTGDSVKLTVYLGRHERIDGEPGYLRLCDLFARHGFDGAAVLLGVDGTLAGRRERARFFGTNSRVPIMVVATAAPRRAREAMDELSGLSPRLAVTAERIRVCKRDGQLLRYPVGIAEPPDAAAGAGPWQKVTVHTSEADRHDGAPIHRVLVRSLRTARFASGATALRAV